MELTKICPECRCEFLPAAETCSDCGVPLVHVGDLVDTPRDELPAASELVPLRIASVPWARSFSEALQQAGIPHRIDAPPALPGSAERRSHDPGVAVYVRAEDHERASAVDQDFLRSQIPDVPDASDAPDTQGDACPACGASVGTDSPECPDCGLPFVEVD